MFLTYKSKLIFIGLASIVAVSVMVAYFYNLGIKSKASGETIMLTFTGENVRIPANQNFEVFIAANPSIQIGSLRGFDFGINFDFAKLQVVDLEYVSPAFVSLGLGDDNNSLTALNQVGRIKAKGEYQLAGGGALNTVYPYPVILKITFRSFSNDESRVSFGQTGAFYQYDNDTFELHVISTISGGDLVVNPPIPTLTPTITPVGPTLTPVPGACNPVNRVILVSRNGGCTNLQDAINSVTEGNVTIKIEPGTYNIPDSGNSFSLSVVNKNNLTITSLSNAEEVTLNFTNNRGGISIQGSTGEIRMIDIVGKTSNGLIQVNQSSGFRFIYGKFSDETASTIQIRDSSDVSIANSEIKSSATGIDLVNTNNVIISGNKISNSVNGVALSSSNGAIRFNLFLDNAERSIYTTGKGIVEIKGNTITSTNVLGLRPAIDITAPIGNDVNQLTLTQNIVAHNSGGGLQISDPAKVATKVELNDFWANSTNFINTGNYISTNGNISADPLFGDGYCLKDRSPAIYGDAKEGEFMGHRGPCNVLTTPGASPPVTIGPPLTGDPGPYLLNLKLKFQGILRQPSDEFNKMKVKISVVAPLGNKGESSSEADFVSDEKGIWSGSVKVPPFFAFPGKGFKLFVKGPKHIQKRICANTPSESFPGTYNCENGQIELVGGMGINDLDFSGIYMLVGDLPQQDGIVNSYDISLVRNNIGSSDRAVLALADLNLDGIVDTQDYSLVIAALSVRSDEGE